MAGYSPLKVTGFQTGLVQERENFLLPDDAFPVLQNAYVWREQILRKKGYQILGRLQRLVDSSATYGSHQLALNGGGNGNLLTSFVLEATGSIVPGISLIDTTTFMAYTDPSKNGTLSPPSGTINYATGAVSIPASAGHNLVATFNYYPNLPVMGLRTRDLQNSANDQLVAFDQKYAYIFDDSLNAFKEFIPTISWNAHGAGSNGTDFFWSTNYWVSDLVNFGTINSKLFWVTNNTGQFTAAADPIRITDGSTWLDFSPPTYGQIDAAPTYLLQCLSFLPFRGRLVTFNTWEGASYAAAVNFRQRIRWSTIGNPFIPFSAGPPARGSWRDDIRGQGGFLDIPTSEDIVAVGFVRDNLVIYCERSTWQLRYTGRSIAPFQIERVNSELGAEGTFSAVQFDTSLLGIGDKGVVECDSYKSERIDIKIPDLVFQFLGSNEAVTRVHGIRDFELRLAYWTYCDASSYDPRVDPTLQIFPNKRLVYNYENDSWAIFTDSLTTLGTYQPQSSRTWLNTHVIWVESHFSWTSQPAGVPRTVGGNQQGFVEFLDELTVNDPSLYISAISGNTTTPTQINSPNHNLETGTVIGISGIPTGTGYASLNGKVFSIIVKDANSFFLMVYNPVSLQFSTPRLDAPATYVGSGLINIRDNFSIVSKKFNFLDDGQNIQLGYIDILMLSTGQNQNAIQFPGNPGVTDGSGNFLGVLSAIFGLPASSVIVPGTFTAIVGNKIYTETSSLDGRLLVNGFAAPPGTFINYDTTQLGLVTGLPTTGVLVNFQYYPDEPPPGEIALNVYLDYNDSTSSNTAPQNDINDGTLIENPDTFFNSIIPTTSTRFSNVGGTKFWQRVYCPTRASFITLEYTLNNAQMASDAQEQDVQIDAQVLWIRKAGRMTTI